MSKETIHDAVYDPELHGDQEAPAAQRGLAVAAVVLLFTLPLYFWMLLR